MSSARQQKKGVPAMTEDALKEDINYWSLKVSAYAYRLTFIFCQSSDLYHELETLKGEAELDDENLDEEYERLCKELQSVQSSLEHMRGQNASLNSEICEKSNQVNQQHVQIRTTEQDIQKIGKQVSFDDLNLNHLA